MVNCIALHAFHREAGEELQMAEVKLAMHKEMLGKDEVGLGAIPRRSQIDTLGDHKLEEQPWFSVNRERAAGRRS